DFSQLLEDGIVLAPERAELGELVYRAVEAARPLIETRRQDLNVQMDGGRAQVHADPARLTQAVTELLIYSARSIPEGSRIWLATEEADEEIVLRIRDNGPGLVPEALPALFELFAVREMDGSSGGLGLPLAHHLIELHGGSLSALSDGPGKGLEFVLRLPVFHAGTEQSAQGSNAGALNGAQRVLLVDDDSDSADGLALILQAQGHVVRVSPRASAVPAAREFRPNVVLVDLAAMDNDREQLAHELRALPETAHALLLALGGSSAVQSHHAAEMPFDHYLVKPVESQALQRIFAESAGVLH
ncbi:MAG TPA: hybrid sensor histidine kinase/response regulator, partial [Burkholderiales bacterium]|nr:hybrid sensor histidine kinase/response regulator [Burkholderiales bacterium]